MLKITNEELIKEIVGKKHLFPKYSTQILNLANQNAQGTRPKVVGQLSELIKECPDKTYEGWKKWYLKKYPHSIDNATEKVEQMVKNLKSALGQVDRKVVREWVEDLVLEKTYIGFRFQEAILKKVAKTKNQKYKIATPREESRGIDGYIGSTPISIKPITYRTKKNLSEKIDVKIIYYEKVKDGIKIDIKDLE